MFGESLKIVWIFASEHCQDLLKVDHFGSSRYHPLVWVERVAFEFLSKYLWISEGAFVARGRIIRKYVVCVEDIFAQKTHNHGTALPNIVDGNSRIGILELDEDLDSVGRLPKFFFCFVHSN